MKYTPVGVDIAKRLMQVHFIDKHTGEIIDKRIKRDALLEYFSNREPCIIGMEACGGSQYWASELKKLDHKVRLLQGKFVKAFVMGNKNDVMDTRAIWMAVQQPSKAVAVKSEEQQAVLSLHNMRRQLVKFRTVQINALHGLLLEFGETVHKGRASLDKSMPEILERLKEKLTPFLIYQIEEQYRRLSDLDMQIVGIEKQLTTWAKQYEACQRIMQIPGVGPLVVTAAVCIMGDANTRSAQGESYQSISVWCQNKRVLAARCGYLALASGGDAYLRTLFIHGARAETLLAKEPNPWVLRS